MAETPEYDVNEPGGLSEYFRQQVGESPEEPEQDPAPEEEAQPPAETEQEPEETPEDGRLAALEKQLADAQQMIGRQANEIGELRQQSEEPEEEDEEVPLVMGDDQWTHLEGLFEEHGGAGMMYQVANRNPELIEPALSLWKENDFRNADQYERQMRKVEAEIMQQGETPPPADPTVAEIRVERAQQQALGVVQEEFGQDRLKAVEPHLDAAFEASSETLKKAISEGLASGDKDATAEAFRTLVKLAEPLTNTEATTLAAEQAAAKSRQAKQKAQVATGSASGTGGQSEEPGDGPLTKEQLDAMPEGPEREKALSKEMARRLVQTETSVARELERSSS